MAQSFYTHIGKPFCCDNQNAEEVTLMKTKQKIARLLAPVAVADKAAQRIPPNGPICAFVLHQPKLPKKLRHTVR